MYIVQRKVNSRAAEAVNNGKNKIQLRKFMLRKKNTKQKKMQTGAEQFDSVGFE